jgi:integrase
MLHEGLDHIPRAIHDNHVFLYEGHRMKQIKRPLKRACEKVGIVYGRFEKNGFTEHELRHTFNTNMRKTGADHYVIMAIMGHSDNRSRKMFNRYNIIDENDLRQAVDRLEGYLLNVDHFVDQTQKRG